MIVRRLIRAVHADEPLSTDGANRYGGRWNPRGAPALYCSETLSLAVLEVWVHIASTPRADRYLALEVEVPDGVVETWKVKDLPDGWRQVPLHPESQAKGAAWLAAANTLALRVPSVVVPSEFNVLLNPRHPSWKRVRVLERAPFVFDTRLLAEQTVA